MSTRYCDKTSKYHDIHVLLDTVDVMREYCSQCKEQWDFTKDSNGRIDNETYREIHQKDVIQPGDKRYDEIYGIK